MGLSSGSYAGWRYATRRELNCPRKGLIDSLRPAQEISALHVGPAILYTLFDGRFCNGKVLTGFLDDGSVRVHIDVPSIDLSHQGEPEALGPVGSKHNSHSKRVRFRVESLRSEPYRKHPRSGSVLWIPQVKKVPSPIPCARSSAHGGHIDSAR